jgi:hypothetical protein
MPCPRPELALQMVKAPKIPPDVQAEMDALLDRYISKFKTALMQQIIEAKREDETQPLHKAAKKE